MYIEFVGIPGAGKTTLVEKVETVLEKEGVRCVTRARFFSKNKTWKFKFFWMVTHVQYLDFTVAMLLYKLSRVKGSRFQKLLIRLHEHQKLQYQISRHDERVVLWDAGYVQRLSNLVSKNILNVDNVATLIYERVTTQQCLLVFVDTPVEESITRMKKREPDREIEGLYESQSQTRQTQQDVLGSLETKGIEVLKVDGTRPCAEQASMVCDSIKRRL